MRKCGIVSAALGLLLGISAAAGAQTRDDLQDGRIRIADAQLRELVNAASRRSPTLRRLRAEIEAGDVVVQVMTGRMRPRVRGSLLHRVVTAGTCRYVFITVDIRGAARRVVGTFAHELQHAIEVAREPAVGRSLAIDRFFMQIANQPCGVANCFETWAAVQIQNDVLRELD